MGIKAVFFDLDGTLLPMDQDVFISAYFSSMARFMTSYGYEPEKFARSVWLGSDAMLKNDGRATNEDVFWETFSEAYGKEVRKDEEYFNAYYTECFDNVRKVCGYNPKARECHERILSLGLRTALATNPVFPRIATEMRAAWAGIDINDFEAVTSYENSFYTKPNINYYKNLLAKMKLLTHEVLMVGNDVSDDMVAKELGMKVFLLTDNLINKDNADISEYPNGNFDNLMQYVENII